MGVENRTCGLWVPFSEPSARRVENRFAGADATPIWPWRHLACGYLGMLEKLQPMQGDEGERLRPATACPRSPRGGAEPSGAVRAHQDMLGESASSEPSSRSSAREYETYFGVI